ncbi:orotidine-5'-phosphate decarboxylase [Rosenbergiella australiborealis]|uniref:Orotidine 5'-phosphate decarboxylase n=1 Tax=Rosenbergiella australiborealis TaxID=1544696 RepID=A0ABS5T208_9GAMM|nr:orotidine-5'-phosphate decarboxylase [Rosenbergiella australiborealis]MBT0726370.1 orotidine-5'-phosphate decarboxylase [Rosenbergiella australiborealis]
MSVSSPVIVALDFDNLNSALALADQIDPQSCRLKIGKEMFTRYGPEVIHALHRRHFELFLDLKFHDIPNTVAKAVSAAADLGVWMVNVHAGGGARMMEAAQQALDKFGSAAPHLIAVTVLTSMDQADLTGLGITDTPSEHATKLARLAKSCGVEGVVCSAHEAVQFKQHFGQDFLLVTPGIRPEGSDKGDQRRIMTPAQAVSAGVDYMVIGRPITQSPDPEASLKTILASLEQV